MLISSSPTALGICDHTFLATSSSAGGLAMHSRAWLRPRTFNAFCVAKATRILVWSPNVAACFCATRDPAGGHRNQDPDSVAYHMDERRQRDPHSLRAGLAGVLRPQCPVGHHGRQRTALWRGRSDITDWGVWGSTTKDIIKVGWTRVKRSVEMLLDPAMVLSVVADYTAFELKGKHSGSPTLHKIVPTPPCRGGGSHPCPRPARHQASSTRARSTRPRDRERPSRCCSPR